MLRLLHIYWSGKFRSPKPSL